MVFYDVLFFLKQTGIYILNGFLIVTFLMVEHIYSVLSLLTLLILVIFLSRWIGTHEGRLLRPWLFFSGIFLVIVSLFSSPPVPLFSLLIIAATVFALVLKLDPFQPAQMAWKLVYGASGYGLIALGTPLLETYMSNTDLASSYSMQGQNYLGMLAGVLLFLFPVGYVALLVKDLFLHKTQVAPAQMVELVRTRGQGRQQ
ncbi:MAG: hypothetical protein K8R40_01175 [Anaerolineaceae bacterium]|nr:hypothetical protein [Anaerolineaceae bacterium]